MKIAVDVNGVLLDNMEYFVEICNKRHKTAFKKNDMTNWEFYRIWGFLEKEFIDIFYKTYENMNSIKFIDENAPNIMKRLSRNYDVYLLSALDALYEARLIEKLNYHDVKQGTQYKEAIIVPEKPWDLKIQHEFDIYIDDNPNLIDPIKKFNNRYLLLYDQPWNHTEITEKNVFRVHNWKEILKVINKLNLKSVSLS